MIPGEHRLKGGAPLLGAEQPGLPGPFGTCTEDDDQQHEDPAPGQDDGLWC
ncbi:hypothetical protein [Streptomyces sp. NBC_00347]|uniref:hypothetical protein n=1 Tax=Streptomyces sp. NBC_00347 TaxID=2975721 RepID=UPI00225041EA|nr:hypothetical protein [Streptomyces sp. NBC_00347]MCX5129998.1 hypothetical protein [Streptomyces sp. NBC_00347]